MSLEFGVSSISALPLEGFSINVGQMVASVKVIRLFSICSISPGPFERFSLNFGQMFALVRQCVGPVTLACRLKVKVTVKGHEFEP